MNEMETESKPKAIKTSEYHLSDESKIEASPNKRESVNDKILNNPESENKIKSEAKLNIVKETSEHQSTSETKTETNTKPTHDAGFTKKSALLSNKMNGTIVVCFFRTLMYCRSVLHKK